MSRSGRDYLKAGSYTDAMFKDKGVRFITVNNDIDSDKQGDNDFTTFLNIINKFYARDSSRKIQAIFKARVHNPVKINGRKHITVEMYFTYAGKIRIPLQKPAPLSSTEKPA